MKCPKCERNILHCEIKGLPVHVNGIPRWEGIAHVCPFEDCQAVLSVAIDPIAIKSDIVKEILENLRKQ
jgi:hypothetical protein